MTDLQHDFPRLSYYPTPQLVCTRTQQTPCAFGAFGSFALRNGYRTWFFFGLSVAEPVELLPDRRGVVVPAVDPEPPGTVPEAPEAAEAAPAEAAEPKLPEVPGEISVVLTAPGRIDLAAPS